MIDNDVQTIFTLRQWPTNMHPIGQGLQRKGETANIERGGEVEQKGKGEVGGWGVGRGVNCDDLVFGDVKDIGAASIRYRKHKR